MNRFKLPKLGSGSSHEQPRKPSLFRDKSQEEAVKKAIAVGLLVYPSKEFILKEYEKIQVFIKKHSVDINKNDELKSRKQSLQRLAGSAKKTTKLDIYFNNCLIEEKLDNIAYLNLSGIPIQEFGDIPFCQNVVILNLSNNYLVDIEPLAECVHLLRLDLQNNQINKLPGKDFWPKLKQLKLLFLHGNPIGKLDFLKNLSFCPALEILTLYDTPLSLKPNYRHHTVNSILTLKFLDDYVISDEEIIEEAKFNNKFRAKCENFKLVLKLTPSNAFETEYELTMKMLSKVNKILAKFSPVVIIQTYFRGLLARKKYRALKNQLKLGAAVLIQQWWKKNHQKIENKLAKQLEKMESRPVNSPESKEFAMKSKDGLQRHNSPSSTYFNKRNIIVDFKKLSQSERLIDNLVELNMENFVSEESSKTNNQENLEINELTKLTKQKLNEEMDTKGGSSKVKPKPEAKKKKKKKTLKKSNTVESEISTNTSNSKDRIGEEDEKTKTRFRIGIDNVAIMNSKEMYIVDFVKEKLYGYSAIKDLEEEAHRIIQEKNGAKLKELTQATKKESFLTMDQRFFKKIYGNMNFSNLKAVDEAYAERDQSDKIIVKQNKVEDMKDLKRSSAQQVEFFKDDHIKYNQTMARRHGKLLEIARLNEAKEFEKVKERVNFLKETNRKINQNRRKDVMLAISFSKQHLSVSKALQRHEFLSFKESQQKANSDFVTKQFNKQNKQHEIVNRFLDQRKVLRIVQSNADRDLLNTRIKNDSEFYEMEAKKRVEYLKSLDYFNKHQLNRKFSLPAIDMTNHFQPQVENTLDYYKRFDVNY